MAIAVSYVGAGAYASVGAGLKTWDIPTLPTGVGVAILVYWGHGSNTATWTSPELSVDGAAQSSSLVSGAGTGGAVSQWHFFPNVQTAEQDFKITNSGSAVNAAAFVFQISGHDTSDMFGNEGSSNSSTTCGITMSAAGNACLLLFGSLISATISGGNGTWDAGQTTGSNSNGKVRWNTTIDSGAVTITSGGSQGVMHAVEIKAAAASSGSNIIRGVKGMTGGMQNLSGGTQ